MNNAKCDNYTQLAGKDVATKTVTKDTYGVVPVNASSDQGYCICEEGSTLPKLSWTNLKILVTIALFYLFFQGVLILVVLLQGRKAKTLKKKEKGAAIMREVIRLEIDEKKGQNIALVNPIIC